MADVQAYLFQFLQVGVLPAAGAGRVGTSVLCALLLVSSSGGSYSSHCFVSWSKLKQSSQCGPGWALQKANVHRDVLASGCLGGSLHAS